MALRARRLASDAETIRRCFAIPGARIQLVAAEGDPPERYRFEYQVKSLVVQNGEVVPSSRQVVEVYLTLSYPRQAPQCRMLTPVFHPNIAPHAVCIGDHWSAGESLAALLVRIAEMLTYQSYNLKSPLNGDAAKWADEHMAELPLEDFDFGSLLAGEQHPPAPAVPSVGPGQPAGAGDPSSRMIAPPPLFGSEATLATATPDEGRTDPLIAETSDEATDPAGAVVGSETTSGGRPEPLVPSTTSPEPLAAVSTSRPEALAPRAASRTTDCPSCGAALSLPENRPPGTWMRCPLCGRMLQV